MKPEQIGADSQEMISQIDFKKDGTHCSVYIPKGYAQIDCGLNVHIVD